MEITKEAIVIGERPEEPDYEEYKALAKASGWSDDDVKQAIVLAKRPARLHDLKAFLAENGICIYDINSVNKYMNAVVRKINRSASWNRTWWSFLFDVPQKFTWEWRPLSSSQYSRGYQQPIPIPVLMTISKIREAFPYAQFSVTEISQAGGDPFLGVHYCGEFFVIERWDEPGFRM